ncbi:MAG TPA: hypothetical protein DD379_14905 [Cyanobacteria bacterium UBA11162]|nr:hypothetical protein [Cyanobacteria bacterium UBA11162]
MSEFVTLELPETLGQQVREIAALTHRQIEDVLVEWIDHTLAELPVESLPDNQVLDLCDLQLEPEQQQRLSELLSSQREGYLKDTELKQLDTLIQTYRQGLVRKARALKVAVERGLRPPLSA